MKAIDDAAIEAAATLTAPSDHDVAGHVIAHAHVGGIAERGTIIGRFVVVDLVGAGGMGVVYKAYDPELDRSVALKVVHARGDQDARARLLREARALAQLSDANVVAIYDVLPRGDDVCIAMELVEGETLGPWVRAPGRTRAQILAAYAAAGRGLAAAHARGIVHRDFKPSNVLVGRDGRVRVADFGLARALDQAPAREPVGTTSSSTTAPVTRTGAIVGTPAYMAPEQASGEIPGPAGDQYSFCVALHEALTGVRPTGPDAAARLRQSELPKWLRALLARGLRARAEERFASMDALLEALVRGQRRRRTVWLALAGATLLLTVSGVVLLARPGAALEPCRDLDEHLAGVWDAGRREQLARAFVATGRGYAAGTAERTAAALDDYSARWVAARTQVCRAAKVRGDEPEARYAARVQCLDRRLAELAQLGELFVRADDTVVAHAHSAAQDLIDPARCAGSDALPSSAPRTMSLVDRAAVATAQEDLAEVSAYWRAESHLAGRPLARALAERTRTLDDPSTHAESLLYHGRLEDTAGSFEAARHAYVEAALAAERAHDDGLRFTSKLALMEVVGNDLNLPDELSAASEEARALWQRLGGDRGREAEWLEVLIGAEVRLGRLDFAQTHATRLLELRQDGAGLPRAQALLAACNVRARRAELAQARGLCDEALALAEAELGAEHPGLARYLDTLGWLVTRQGRYAEGEALFRRALALVDAAYGPESDPTSLVYIDLGNNLRQQKRLDESLAILGKVVAIESRRGREKSALVAGALTNYGQTLVEMSRYDEAMVYLARALDTYRSLPGRLNPAVSWTLSTVAVVDFNRGAFDKAFAGWREAASAIEQVLGPDSPQLIWPLSRLAAGLHEKQRLAEVVPVYERALALADRSPPDFRFHAQLESGLGEALLGSGGDRARGLTLLEAARARMVAGGASAAAIAPYDELIALHRKRR